ncbi:MAG: hypothetical protein Q7J28_16040 [Caulobacter sp.]|nr:hypothetical protein [Caulobacter sp.]
MFNLELLKTRLSQYGAAWLIAFALSAVALVGGPWLLDLDVIDLADRVLPAAFTLIGLGLIVFLAMALISGETLGTKLALLLLTVLLALPLLWSPVLAAVGAAWLFDRSIEYSAAYARFRIVVGDLVYPLVQSVFSGALFETVWQLMQLFAGLVGFVSAFARAWPWIKRLLGREPAAA